MSINAKLLPLESPIAGRAILQVRGWDEDAGQLAFAIQRNQDEYYLQQNQQWASAPCWFEQHFSEDAGAESISYQAGPELVDPLLLCPANSLFNFRLRTLSGSLEEENPMRLAPGLSLSMAGGEGVASAQSSASLSAPSTPAAVEPPVVPEIAPEPLAEPVIEPQPEPEAQAPATVQKKRSIWVWLLPLLLVLLLLITAAVWFFLLKKTPEPEVAPAAVPEVAAPVATTQPEVAFAPCAVENMGTLSELQFVQGCVKNAPSSEELLQVINSAKEANHCGIAQRLYANRAQSGDVQVAQAYAREYDPKYHQASSCFAEADAATAAYWYETILASNPDDAEAKQRFEELKP